MPKRMSVDPDGKPVAKFAWTRLAGSIVREMYNRATAAADLCRLTPEQRKLLYDRIGSWAGNKVGEYVRKKVCRQKHGGAHI